MIVKNLQVKNKNINFKNINLNFEENGLYLITGLNAIGKTTILEKILFSKDCCFFSNAEKTKEFKKKRNSLFTYISQNIYPSNEFIYTFLTKTNKFNEYKIKDFLKLFNLSYLDDKLKSIKFSNLSGGEKRCIHLISGLLKDTEYVFLDEPTNDLDEERINILINYLNKIKENKKIIIISHLNDFKKVSNYNINILKNEITDDIKTREKNKKENDNKIIDKKINKPFSIFHLLFNKVFLISFFIFTFLSFFTSSFTLFYLKSNIYHNEKTNGNYITGDYTGVIQEDNLEYIINQKFNIEQKNIDKTILYKNIPEISDKNDVSDIYLFQSEYKNEITLDVKNNGYSLKPYAVPKGIYDNIKEYSVFCFQTKLLNGNYPNDYQQEVSLSKNILKKHFGINENYLNKKIPIIINGETVLHKIVGIIDLDLVLVSINKKQSLGVYRYDKNNYKSFLALNNIEENDIIDNLIIKTNNKDAEREIVNHLVKNYPACGLGSDYFFNYLNYFNNSKIYKKSSLIYLSFYILIIILIILINFKTNKFHLLSLKNYENYYLSKNRYIFLYILFQLLFIFLILVLNSIPFLILKNEIIFQTKLLVSHGIALIFFYLLSYLSAYFINSYYGNKIKRN